MTVIRSHEQVRFHAGYFRGIAYDLPRSAHHFLPKALVCVLQSRKAGTLTELQAEASAVNVNLDEWLSLLYKEELIFDCPVALSSCFPPLALHFQRPLKIDTAVLPLPVANTSVMRALEATGCQHLSILMTPEEGALLDQFWRCMEDVSITSVSIHFEQDPPQSLFDELNELMKGSSKLRFIDSLLSANKPSSRRAKHLHPRSKQKLSGSFEPCLTINLDVYLEALEWNVYFNRKVFIDRAGRISYGDGVGDGPYAKQDLHTALTDSLTALATPKLWITKKDDIAICSDCELRYMCIDPRLPSQRPDGGYAYTTECNYNPYICKWKGEEGYRTLAECGVISNAAGFSIDHDRIAAINAELWGE